MSVRIVKITLTADVRGLTNALNSARNATSSFVRDNRAQVSQASTAMLGLGAAAVGAVGLVVKQAAAFDKAMASVKAATHAAGTEIESLRRAAISAGADTAFSAVEAAQGIEELAKAGVSTADILGGGLAGALDLAAAGQIGVAEAAETAASALTQFGLSGADVSHVADLLAAGAGKAQGSVSDLGAALGNAGVVAANTGLSIEETTGFLAAMASYGLTGAEAGTQLKSMLQSLQAPSSTAKKALAELGLSMYDAEGNTKSLTQFVGEYRASLQGRTQAEKDSLNATIFGSYGINAAGVAYKQGADGIQEWINAVNDAGYAADTASMLTDHLMGDIERLGGSLETVFIQSGSGANDSLRGIVQGTEAVVDAIGKIPEPVLSATTLIAGAGGMGALAVGATGKMVVGFVEVRDSIRNLGNAASLAKGAIGGIGAAVAIGAIAFGTWAKKAAETRSNIERIKATLDSLGNTTDDTARSVIESLSKTSDSFWKTGRGAESVLQASERLGLSIDDVTKAALGSDAAFARVKDTLGVYGGSVYEMSQSNREFTVSHEQVLKAILENRENVAAASEEQRRLTEAQIAAGLVQEDLGETISATSTTIGEQTELTEEAAKALDDWRKMVQDASTDFRDLGEAWQSAIDQQREYAEAAAKATKSSKDSWEDYYDGVSVSADQWIEQLRKQAEAQASWAQNVITASQQVREELPANMTAAADAMIDDLIARGPEGAEMLQAFVSATPEQRAEIVATWADMGRDIVAEVESIRNPSITIDANTDLAFDETTGLLSLIDTSKGTVTVIANGAPLRAELGRVTAEVDEASGTVTIRGEDGEAVTTLRNFTTTVDDASGSVRIEGDDTSGRRVVVGLTNWVTTQGASITINADTSAAVAKLNAVRTQFLGLGSVGVGTVLAPGRALGGPITGGIPGKDSVPILAMPGEHVLTTKDVAALGGQAGVYALRAALHGGVQAFASGGAVHTTFGMPSTKGKGPEYWQAAFMDFPDRLRLLKDIWRMESELPGLAGLDRASHEQEIREAKTKLSEAEYAATIAKGDPNYWPAQVTAAKNEAAKKETGSALSLAASRGNLAGSASSGLSGAQSLVDRLLSAGGDSALSGKQQSSLTKAATSAEKSYAKLYGTLTHVTDQLDAAKEKASELQRISDQTANALSGGFGLMGSTQATTSTTTNRWGETWATTTGGGKAGILAAASAYASKVKALAGKISKLVAKGFRAEIVSEVGAAGVEGGTVMADALLSMSAAEVKRLNGDYAAIATYSAQAGQAVTTAYSPGGLSAASKQVGTLTAQQQQVQGQITGLSRQLEDLLLGAYGVPARAKGGPVWPGQPFLVGEQGAELFMPQQSGYILPADATRRLAASSPGGGQQVQVSLDKGALAQAMHGTALTLVVDGQPMHAVIDARLDQATTAADRAAAYL